MSGEKSEAEKENKARRKALEAEEDSRAKSAANATKASINASVAAMRKQGCAGIYVYRNNDDRIAIMMILKPDGTSGMFVVPAPNTILWMGSSTYKLTGTIIKFPVKSTVDDNFEIQNVDTGKEFIEAEFVPGRGFIQDESLFDLLTDKLDYWLNPEHTWEKIGVPRRLEPLADYEIGSEIRKLVIAMIDKFGNQFGW